MTKRKRRLPEKYHFHMQDGVKQVFSILGKITINDYAVCFSKHLDHDENAPEYSDADLNLYIARLEKAKESIVENIDGVIEMLKEIL